MKTKPTSVRLSEHDIQKLQELKKTYWEVNKSIKFTDSLMIRICIQNEYDRRIKHIDR